MQTRRSTTPRSALSFRTSKGLPERVGGFLLRTTDEARWELEMAEPHYGTGIRYTLEMMHVAGRTIAWWRDGEAAPQRYYQLVGEA